MWKRLARGFGALVLHAGYGVLVSVIAVAAGYSAFSLFVRRGVLTVPEVVGRDVREATSMLRDAGLRLRHVPEYDRFDEEFDADLVRDQRPRAGSLVKRGGVVEVSVSMGQARVAVPNLVGQALSAAQVNLVSSQLGVGRVASIYGGGSPPGTVMAQDPAPGDLVERGRPVHVFLALEDPAAVFVMPDLVARSYEETRRFFAALGFQVGNVKFDAYEGAAAGVVLRQFPLAGHPVSRLDVISLVVSPPVEPVP